ncbi:MAG: HAMP domain-containing sensor histidine kinase [Myxococcota bacterium]
MTSLPIVCPAGAANQPATCPISKEACPGFCIFSDVMESVRLGVALFNLEQRTLTFLNTSAREIFKDAPEPITFDSLCRLLVPRDVDIRTFTPPLTPEPLRLKNRIVGYTLYQSRGYAWAFLRDVTEKARLESIAEAVELMNSLGFVFSAVRHELGNPINSVKAALTVLRANFDRFSREQHADYLDRMLLEIGRVEHLLHSMKSFSMYERMQPQPVDIETFLKDYQRLIRDEAERRNLALRIQCAPDVRAHCDPRALQQVFLNLFANAADALEGQADAEVRIEVDRLDNLVRICFSDNGPGLSEEQKEALFKPFHTSKEKGTGLGLVITRKLLAQMQGTITVESSEGRGLSAIITLLRAGEPPSRAAGERA